MKRFLKILALLIVSLFVVVSGVDAALDHLCRTLAQNTYTYYNERGDVVMAYTCEPTGFPVETRPATHSLHRT